MEHHLDLTIDFETCSLSANAAVMQVAIVPWLRDKDCAPFFNGQPAEHFVGYVDLRTCVVKGFDFDPKTIEWWSRQSDAAKASVCAELPEPINDVLKNALDYVRNLMEENKAQSVCLWCQGPDLDIAILRNLCLKFGMKLEDYIPHTSFRDCRTVILEAALIMSERRRCDASSPDGVLFPDADLPTASQLLVSPSKAYALYPPLPDLYSHGEEHDAVYDAVRSTWNTWYALKWLRGEAK